MRSAFVQGLGRLTVSSSDSTSTAKSGYGSPRRAKRGHHRELAVGGPIGRHNSIRLLSGSPVKHSTKYRLDRESDPIGSSPEAAESASVRHTAVDVADA